MSETGRTIVILASAYLIAGIYYVWCDLQMHVVHQPAYAREYTLRGRLSPLIWAVVGWLPPAILRMQIGSLLLFLASAAVGLYLSSI